MVGFLYKLGGGYLDDVATILYIGLLSVEGDEHKHQVRFFLGSVRELLSNTTISGRFWSVMLGYWSFKHLTIR